MPYATNADLPAAVRSKLKGKKLRQWRHVWNSAYDRHGDESRAFAEAWATVKKASGTMSEFSFFMPIAKINRDKRTVSGYASTPTRDSDGEIVTLEAVKNALPDYMNWRNIREMHALKAVGTAEEANVDRRGLFLTARIVDDQAWQKCLEGVYKGFSIGGRKLAKSGDTITKLEMTEISVVDRPANPDCRINIAKSASLDAEGYLVRPKEKVKLSIEQKAMAKMAKVVQQLAIAKAGPPAVRDGLSLPAQGSEKPASSSTATGDTTPEPTAQDNASPRDPTRENNKADGPQPCEAHGKINCPVCMDKREFSTEQRESLAGEGKALPDGSYPIENFSDLRNTIQAFGRAKDKAKTKAHIKSRARALGATKELPESWSKLAKRLAKAELHQALGLGAPTFLSLASPRTVLSTILGDNTMATAKKVDGNGAAAVAPDTTGDPLTDAIAKLMKRAAEPSKAARLGMARKDMKECRKAMKECRKAIEDAHKMHKAAFLAKAARGKKPPPDEDDDEFDHTGAMEKLQKAYGELEKARTFGKAAIGQIRKAQGRSGQRGEEVTDSEGKFYEVPPGLKEHSPIDLAGASPGGPSNAGQPPLYPDDGSVYPGKAAPSGDLAKYAKDGQISAEVVELIMKNAKAEGELEALKRLPAAPTGGRRPFNFDLTKITAGTSPRDLSKTLFDGVDPNALNSGDERAHTEASARVIGNFISSGQFGKSVFDPAFKGAAGSAR